MFITNVRDFLWEEDRLCLSYKSFFGILLSGKKLYCVIA